MFTYTKYMIEANRLPVEFMTEDLYHSDLVDDILGIRLIMNNNGSIVV